MTLLVIVETFVLVLLVLLVAGLLRSHAEILRRLEERPSAQALELEQGRLTPVTRPTGSVAFDLAGTTLAGEPIKVTVQSPGTTTLLAFLTSGCLTCRGFWEAFAPQWRPAMPGGARLVLVTKDTDMESPSKLRELAPPDVTLVMSTAAWDAYHVPMSPYFILVDGTAGEVVGEGTAETWPQVLSLLTDAVADLETAVPRPTNGHARPPARVERTERIDAELAEAGIGPEHPSLYTAGHDDDGGREP